jgi:hypothetical protein
MKRNLVGITFNMLTATEFHHKGRHGLSFYEFMCECGQSKVLCGTDVSQGKTKSCGCFRRKWPLPQTLPLGVASCNSLYLAYRDGAKSRNLVFDLTRETFEKLTKKSCEYCGVLPYKEWTGTNRSSSAYVYNGLDRVDNTQGYTLSNVAPCCMVCNKAKHSMTVEQFKEWIVRLVNFHTLKVPVNTGGKN